MNELIQTIAVYALPVLFAITLHEAAHAYAAKYFGDLTAYQQGRLSLNPLNHIDLFGTVVMPVVLYLATSGTFLFGYAKPVPVYFGNLRNPKRDMAWVALAGPAANFVMALLWLIFAILLDSLNINEPFFYDMAHAGQLTNLVMFAFNLVPIPPLDGGRVVISVLPLSWAYKFARLEPYGFFIVLALVLLKILNFWIIPVILYSNQVLIFLVSPLKFLLT